MQISHFSWSRTQPRRTRTCSSCMMVHQQIFRLRPIHLHVTYTGRWIGRSELVAWLPCGMDLNPLDFFFWGHLLYMRCRWLQQRVLRHGSSSLQLALPAH
ncbi:hypothetical protein TNCV_3187231 [Trichonephila clavipes]|nr:hypothetical protein TNCV_3187231 [Trichonephila clavipes]